MNLAIVNIPDSLDPIEVFFGHHVIVMQMLYQTLVKTNEEGNLSPSLAKSWFYDESMTRLTVNLDNVYFHNGKMVTAQDVVFSISRHVWEGSRSLDKEAISSIIAGADSTKVGQDISGIKVIDEKTLLINLKKPYTALLSLLSITSFSILSKSDYLKKKELVGSGPFSLLEKSDKIVLGKYKKFNLKSNHPDKIVIQPYETNENLKEILNDDQIDVALVMSNIFPISEINKSKFDYTKMEAPAYAHFFKSSEKGFLANRKGRTFFKKIIMDYAEKSLRVDMFYEPMKTLIPPGLLPVTYYKQLNNKFDEVYEFDKSIKYKVLVSKRFFSQKMILELEKHLGEYGLDCEVTGLDGREFQIAATGSSQFDIVFGAYAADFPDIDGIISPLLGTSGWHYGKYPVGKYIHRIADAKHIKDQSVRLKMYSDILKEFDKESFVFPMFRSYVQLIHRKSLKLPKANFRYESELWKVIWLTDENS